MRIRNIYLFFLLKIDLDMNRKEKWGESQGPSSFHPTPTQLCVSYQALM